MKERYVNGEICIIAILTMDRGKPENLPEGLSFFQTFFLPMVRNSEKKVQGSM